MRTLTIANGQELENVIRAVERGEEAAAGGEAHLEQQLASTRAIVEAVRVRGDAAVAEFTQKFDGVALDPGAFEISQSEIDAAFDTVDRELVGALERALENIRAFHARELRQSWEETSEDGTILGRRITALERVGVYVPGATAFYPSSVLMNIVPASVAGVEEIIMVSPPSFNGTIHPLVLAAAKVAGATRVFRIGGAQSIAAMAYGTGIIPAVPKITGPGNIYVTLAKRLVSSVCAIDMEAGPSEVVVLADAQADPREVAAEMLAQAEHNPDSVAILVTPSAELPGRVETVIEEELRLLERAETIRESLARFGTIYVVPGLEDAVRLTNVLAPEHLSIQVEDPMAVFEHIRNAGAVMLGGGTPVAVTDYYAGPNHILPTGRRARFSSPLSAEDFRKVTNYVSYSKERLQRDAGDIMRLATSEKLTAHARAVEIRK
ncbi:MAG TPA: histidinol dehydrogenase [Candidatus Hydrogenedentes bacterium]|nr:histidinol dehydrogenase [Candidatus Hydrogenedentota bacterium]NLT60728.1 histidinol dehydrogenase [Candidatus Hydrogenedentota bacterium]HNZ18382.1 histidinol dehydrogenase [Candidatus Hydrogenedentota bacterium]HOH33099.1 histidinol dehydrogenase [Candidatus Hydrogenedentota bacterium]HPA04339.1 histidinol dehydrogenase [Candidatus Hydrogenedentota bacterium]